MMFLCIYKWAQRWFWGQSQGQEDGTWSSLKDATVPFGCFFFTLEDIFAKRDALVVIVHWNSSKMFVFAKTVNLALLDTGPNISRRFMGSQWEP